MGPLVLTPTSLAAPPKQVIHAVLYKHGLSYYQGYHDLLGVLVLVLSGNERLCLAAAERLSLDYLSDAMQPSFDRLLPTLNLLLPLLHQVDPDLGSLIDSAGIGPLFALPWVITWFSHDLKDLAVAARVFDACICCHESFSIYLCAAVVRHRREALLSLGGCDAEAVLQQLVRIPKDHDLPFDTIICDAAEMMEALPPHRLAALIEVAAPKASAGEQGATAAGAMLGWEPAGWGEEAGEGAAGAMLGVEPAEWAEEWGEGEATTTSIAAFAASFFSASQWALGTAFDLFRTAVIGASGPLDAAWGDVGGPLFGLLA
jgi:hypothetical protein